MGAGVEIEQQDPASASNVGQCVSQEPPPFGFTPLKSSTFKPETTSYIIKIMLDLVGIST